MDEEKGGCFAGVYGLGVILLFMMAYFSWEKPFWESLFFAVIWPITLGLEVYQHWLENYR